MLVPVTFIISALFLAVAAFARDFKDGQNFLMPVYMMLLTALKEPAAIGLDTAWQVPEQEFLGQIFSRVDLRGSRLPPEAAVP